MILLNLLVLAIAFVVLIGYVAIIVAAFRQSALWGLVVLFVPFGFVVFAVRFWDDVRETFPVVAKPVGIVLGAIVVAAIVVPLFRHHDQPKPVTEQKPAQTDSAAMVVNTTPEPEPAYIAPPPAKKPAPIVAAQPEPEQPAFKKVYVDNASGKFFPEDCKNPPPNAYKMARSVAVSQGYKESACP